MNEGHARDMLYFGFLKMWDHYGLDELIDLVQFLGLKDEDFIFDALVEYTQTEDIAYLDEQVEH